MTTATETTAALLKDTATITALIGTRYWPDIAPDDAALPRVTFQVISEIRNDFLSGPGIGKRCRVQINCWDRTRTGADAVANAVEVAASNAQGRIVFRQSTYDSDAQIYWTQLDWSIPVLSP
jgi:hypothetical protein